MKTIGEVLKLSTAYLEERKIDRPRRIAEELLSHVLQLKKMDLYLQFDKPIVESELAILRDLMKKCASGEPLENVIGEEEFFGCKIQINTHVLIPRPETEILAELISKRVKKGHLWDVCTGSGYLGIALKKALPELTVTLSDICPEALALAALNAKRNGVEVEILEGDLLAPFAGRKVDFFVCNPPYISDAEYSALDPSVRDYEPKLALLGGARGTEFYERLQRELPLYLNPGAQVFLEIGSTQGEVLKKLFPKGVIHFDWAGHPRFFFISY
jgi:release factor glutamine methyltransferase